VGFLLCCDQEQPDLPDLGSAPFRGMGPIDVSWTNPDVMRNCPEPTYSGHKRPQVCCLMLLNIVQNMPMLENLYAKKSCDAIFHML